MIEKNPYVITILLTFLLISCGELIKESNKKKDKLKEVQTDIKWYAQWYGSGQIENLIHEVARDFSFINQEYNVNVEFAHQVHDISPDVPHFNLTADTIVRMIETDEWPFDIMLCDIYLYDVVSQKIGRRDWAEKYFMDFKDEKWFQDSHKDVIYNSNRYINQYGGIAPGAYIESFWDLMFLNEETEKKLGIDVKRKDMTMDDFFSYAQAVFEYNKNHDEKVTFFLQQRWEMGYDNLLTHGVMSILGKERNISPDEAYNALYQIYSEFEGASRFLPAQQYTEAKNEWELKSENVLFVFHSSWVKQMWGKYSPDKVGLMRMCELPTLSGNAAPAYPGNYNPIFVVPRNAKNKEAGIKLMKFISSVDIGEKWMKYAKAQTGLKNKIGYSDFDKSDMSVFAHHIETKYNNVLQSYSLSKVLFGENINVQFHPASILRGEMTAEEALNSVKEQVQSQL